eukprot:CAMPEP_0206491324 /NCGR_PEP_ID=MMETSP0324_2-20121206/44895_1 /ASSEMBLY_ACC=CAM_ASM_000836 /TAXON_ID=2866 /ORGANISM="Crypthecodinium cohnii, Strain Seligo" /LENGTH=124 /DNA_ID=CAMNT_0053972427 /DNA_START=594 /DNA_END=968 /DNA_ORIENTATION=+
MSLLKAQASSTSDWVGVMPEPTDGDATLMELSELIFSQVPVVVFRVGSEKVESVVVDIAARKDWARAMLGWLGLELQWRGGEGGGESRETVDLQHEDFGSTNSSSVGKEGVGETRPSPSLVLGT